MGQKPPPTVFYAWLKPLAEVYAPLNSGLQCENQPALLQTVRP
jgi:hypothetical protein